MDSIVTVPASLSGTIRSGLHNVLSDAAQEVAAVADRRGREDHPEWFAEPIARFKHICDLIEVVGWGKPAQPTAALIPLSTHGQGLVEALDMALVLADAEIEELEAVDAARAARHEPSVREATISRTLALHQFAAAVKEAAHELNIPGAN